MLSAFPIMAALLSILDIQSVYAGEVTSSLFSNPALRGLGKRDSTTNTLDIPFQTTFNFQKRYSVNCSIGTPQQPISIDILTQTGDTQIPNITYIWDNGSLIVQPKPPYNPTDSLSHKDSILKTQFNQPGPPVPNVYNISQVNATYSSDDLFIAGLTINSLPYISSLTRSILNEGTVPGAYFSYSLGLGLRGAEAALWSDDKGDGSPFPTFLEGLKNTSVVGSNAYSIYLDSESDLPTGHLLLGGINKNRYQGDLITLPTTDTTIQSYGTGLTFTFQTVLTVALASILTTTANTTKLLPNTTSITTPIALYQDSHTYLPSDLAIAIWAAVGATWNNVSAVSDISTVTPIVPCSYLTNSSTLDFVFAGAPGMSLKVPMSDLTWHYGTGPTYSEGATAKYCQFLVKAQVPGLWGTLSADVMKRLYTVWDIDNREISVALTNFDNATTATDNIVEIPTAGISALPKPSSSSSKRKLAIGLGVALPLLFLLFLALGCLFCVRKRRFRKERAAAVEIGGGDVGDKDMETSTRTGTEMGSEGTVRSEMGDGTPVLLLQHTNELMSGDARYQESELHSGVEERGQRWELPGH